MLSEGIAAAQEVEGRGHHHTGSGRKGPPNHQKLQEGLVDTPEMDESAKNTRKLTEGPVNAPEVPPKQQKLTEVRRLSGSRQKLPPLTKSCFKVLSVHQKLMEAVDATQEVFADARKVHTWPAVA